MAHRSPSTGTARRVNRGRTLSWSSEEPRSALISASTAARRSAGIRGGAISRVSPARRFLTSREARKHARLRAKWLDWRVPNQANTFSWHPGNPEAPCSFLRPLADSLGAGDVERVVDQRLDARDEADRVR